MTRITIVGGGAVGSSIALFVRHAMPNAVVTVLERDPSYARASSALSASSIRQQFSSPINIDLSLFGRDYLRQPRVKEAVCFTEGGYLLLSSTDAGSQILTENVQLQQSKGADIRFLTPTELKATFPWLHVDDLTAGARGMSGEGWFDGFCMLRFLRKEAIQAGATFVRAEAVDMASSNDCITSVGFKRHDNPDHVERIECDYVVNAGGPWARSVAAMANLDCPVSARRRVVYVVRSAELIKDCPLVVDPSGMWFRGDGCRQFLVGIPPAEGKDLDDLPLDITEEDRERFDEVVWPTLATRVPVLDALQLRTSWAGYYEMHDMDHNAIVGPHPTKLKNFLFACGFSGHGMQHSVGIGRALAEWISLGRYESIDLSPLGYGRVLSGTPFHEKNVI